MKAKNPASAAVTLVKRKRLKALHDILLILKGKMPANEPKKWLLYILDGWFMREMVFPGEISPLDARTCGLSEAGGTYNKDAGGYSVCIDTTLAFAPKALKAKCKQ